MPVESAGANVRAIAPVATSTMISVPAGAELHGRQRRSRDRSR